MEEIKDTLARNLRVYRKLAKLSQEKLGEACGLHRTYIGGIEQRRINVSLKNIGKIALALHINPVFLFVDPSYAESMSEQWEAAARAEAEGASAAGAAGAAGAAAGTSSAARSAKVAHAANTPDIAPVIPGGYALCTWHGEEVQLDPIHVDDPDLAVSILVALIEHGHTDDLAQAFEAAQGYIRALNGHTHRARHSSFPKHPSVRTDKPSPRKQKPSPANQNKQKHTKQPRSRT